MEYEPLNSPGPKRRSGVGFVIKVVLWGAFLALLVFSVTGASIACWMKAHEIAPYKWIVDPQIGLCVNVTNTTFSDGSAFPQGSQKIENGRAVIFYNTCPRPYNSCEASVCGGDGTCFFELTDGAQCATDRDCAILFNSTDYSCFSNCSCIYIPPPTTPAYIPFVPAGVTVYTAPTTVPAAYSSALYRVDGNTIEIEVNAYGVNISTVINYKIVTVDISNLPYTLFTSATYYGIGYATIQYTDADGTEIGGPLYCEGYSYGASIFTFAFEPDYYNPSFITNLTVANVEVNGRLVNLLA